ncbi:MAG: DUF4262 domain-containing protein [Actinobacteria bacterium]|nr:DUF4262 domain-containing protein [Actinomycetota bacterium]
MCWICDHPEATDEDYLERLRQIVRSHGWAVQYIESDRTPFAYTVGLHDCGLPELLVSGVSPDRARRLLSTAARAALRGESFTPGRHTALRAGPLVEVVEVEHPDVHLAWALNHGGPGVRALQLVWADERGRWPWAPRFADGRVRQPVLGVRAPRRRRQNA